MKTIASLDSADKYSPLVDGPRRLAQTLGGHRLSRQSVESRVSNWLAGGTEPPWDVDRAMVILAWAQALPELAESLSADLWKALLDRLLTIAADARRIDMDQRPLIHQLLAGELPWTLAEGLPEIAARGRLAASAQTAFSAGLNRLLDGQGLPHARHMEFLRPLLACWTRCRGLGEGLQGGAFPPRAEDRYRRLVRSALRLARHDGRNSFSNGETGPWGAELFETAIRLTGDAETCRIAAVALPPSRKRQVRKPSKASALPSAAAYSERAATAVLRRDWSRASERLVVLYPNSSVALELVCNGEIAWSGEWECEIRRNGDLARPVAAWKSVCWASDEDADYLELEIELTGGLRVQRSMVLARKDRFLLLADAVLGDQPGKLDYRGILPLARGVAFHGAAESREGSLVGSKKLATVLPLALPEWRSQGGAGELVSTSQGLELQQASDGRRLLAPLFFDLDRDRMRRQLTWRQLTVAQSLAIQPADVAVGYRVAIGRQQWLIYRSLGAKANRTVLGHNLSTESLVARFDRTGEVEPIIEIE